MNMYLQEELVRERLEEARALAARLTLIQTLRPVRVPVRVATGLALIRFGRWLAGPERKRRAESGRVMA